MKRMRDILHGYWMIAGALKRRGTMSRLALFSGLLSIPLRKKAVGRKPRRLDLRYAGRESAIYVRDAADIAVLKEVFVDKEYDICVPSAPASIIDIGSHIGISSVFFSIVFPGSSITAYEPDPDNFALLSKNTSDFKNIRCVNAAVAARSGKARLTNHSGSSISGSIMDRRSVGRSGRFDGEEAHGIEVETVGIDEAIDRAGGKVGLIKFDVEGAEYDMLLNCRKILSVRALVGELHLDLIEGKTKEDFRSVLSGFEISEKTINDRRVIISATRI